MPDNPQPILPTKGSSTDPAQNRVSISSRLEHFEKRQADLLRLIYLILVIVVSAFLWTQWSTLRSFVYRLEGAAFGLVALVLLVGAYAWRRTREISELRGLVRGLEQRDVTSANDKQLEQLFGMISRSQQGYRDLIDSFDDVLIALSLEGEIRAANRRFSDLLGLNFQQIIGKKISDFLDESGGQGTADAQEGLPRFLERRNWSGVVQVRFKNRNAVHYFDCVAHAMVRDEVVHGITVLARDVTALRRNEARFTELFETLQEGIYIVTPEDRIMDANPALVRILGYDSKDDLLARKVSDVFPDESLRNIVRSEVDRQPVLEGREIILIRKDGKPITCLNTAAAVRDTSGKIIRYQGALMDVTARREIERRLHKQQEFARRLVDSFPDVIFVVDTQARYTFVSPRVKEVLGMDVEETMAKSFAECVHPDDQSAVKALYADIASGKQNFGSLEVRIRHKAGDWRYVRSHFSPLSAEAGGIDGVVISSRDVTELKRLSEQLIQSEKLAAIGQMLAGVAHELNNPLTAILGVTELVREREGLDDAMKRQLDLTHRQARRAARIVQNLLEFARPAAPQRKPVDINNILERTLQLHEHSLRRNSIEVSIQRQEGIANVVGDASQLIQVFLNLLINAEQAICEVRDSGRIRVRVASSSRKVTVTIQDDGVGISQEAASKIFDPFYTTKRPGGGTGLGLSICVAILREHAGTVEAQSLPAGGSAFTVVLPAAAPEQSPSAPTHRDTSQGGTAHAGSQGEKGHHDPDATPASSKPPVPMAVKGRRILVLDDEESIRSLLEEGLSNHGLRVACAASAEEAAKLAATENFDALLCDLNLGATGGISSGHEAAAHVVAAAGPNKPIVIFMTGELVSGSEDRSGLGGTAFLQKPFRILDVLAVLRESFTTVTSSKP
ncbi:MAG TPA: PAS domain S-box protein [Candidatus Sulfotelmatobacter sp.]|jgi:PAS domain S-box-containing protein|nr:PAS domain S-box protein [Candidatus Sulfotelmatobacter sp.]